MMLMQGLGDMTQQPGGVRTLSGSWSIEHGNEVVTGNGGNKARSELRQGNTITFGNAQHTVASDPSSDGEFTLTSPWGGKTSESANIQVSGLLPLFKDPGARRPIYKSPLGIILILGVTGAAAYGGWWLYKRYRAKKAAA